MKINNKGFTVYELLIGFVFLIIIGYFLTSTVFSLKERNQGSLIKTKLLDLKIAVTKDIEEDIMNYQITDAISCGSTCVDFYYTNSVTKRLTISTTTNIVKYGNNEYLLIPGSYMGVTDITANSVGGEGILKVKVPILHDDIKGDYGISIATKYYPNFITSIPVYLFDYTGSNYQTFSAPVTGKYKFELWGAQGGGNDPQSVATGSRGGAGAYTSGQISLVKDEKIYIYIGGQGQYNGTLALGGYNGGGYGTWTNPATPIGGGGGATDVRLVSGLWDDITSLRSRIMVAGGGAGSDDTGVSSGPYLGANDESGGAGGTLLGIAPRTAGVYAGYGYGTQISAGVAGAGGGNGGFGYGGNSAGPTDFGGGGAGYYGGASGGGSYQGGGGGSSFISGYTGCNAVNASGTHTGTPNHYSGRVFTNTSMISGISAMTDPDGATVTGHNGNGYAKISWVSY